MDLATKAPGDDQAKRSSRKTAHWWIVAVLLISTAVILLIVSCKSCKDTRVTYVRVPSPDGRYVAITAHVIDPLEGIFDAAWITRPDTEQSKWHQVIPYRDSSPIGEITACWESNTRLVFETRRIIPGMTTWGDVTIEVRLIPKLPDRSNQ